MKHIAILAMAAALFVAGCNKKTSAQEPAATAAADAAPTSTLLETARAAGNFTVLLAAIDAAGLTETLNGAGPFTVFAPTDEAFAKIPKADLDAILADKAKLTAILTYHVVAGNKLAAEVGAATSLPTVQGAALTVDTASGVKVGGANVLKTDIATQNGTIHVIDAVLVPAM